MPFAALREHWRAEAGCLDGRLRRARGKTDRLRRALRKEKRKKDRGEVALWLARLLIDPGAGPPDPDRITRLSVQLEIAEGAVENLSATLADARQRLERIETLEAEHERLRAERERCLLAGSGEASHALRAVRERLDHWSTAQDELSAWREALSSALNALTTAKAVLTAGVRSEGAWSEYEKAMARYLPEDWQPEAVVRHAERVRQAVRDAQLALGRVDAAWAAASEGPASAWVRPLRLRHAADFHDVFLGAVFRDGTAGRPRRVVRVLEAATHRVGQIFGESAAVLERAGRRVRRLESLREQILERQSNRT